jgi:membrane protein DedA with SNARE-associated domain
LTPFRLLHHGALFSALILILGLGLVFAGLADTGPAPLSPPDQAAKGSGLPAQAPPGQLATDLANAAAHVTPLLERYGYPVLFAAVLVEGIGIPAPGQTLLIAASLTAARGDLSIAWVMTWALTAAWLGNSLGYLIGFRGGRPLLKKLHVNEEHLQRMESSFARAGGAIILVARFVDGTRQLNGIVAGLLQLPWGQFTKVNILGALLWVGFWGLGSYFLEREVSKVQLTLRQVEPWIAGLALIAFFSLIAYTLWHRRTHDP